MFKKKLEHVISVLNAAGIHATADARNINTPCCFVTVTKLSDFTLAGTCATHGEITAMVADLGGESDIDNMDKLVTDVLEALFESDIAVGDVQLNQQATPPNGGRVPATTISYSLFM